MTRKRKSPLRPGLPARTATRDAGSADGGRIGQLKCLLGDIAADQRIDPGLRERASAALPALAEIEQEQNRLAHRLETELSDSETRLRQLLHALDMGVVVQNADREVLLVNPGASRILERTESELVTGGRIDGVWEFVDEQGQPLRVSELPANRALRECRAVASTTVGVFDAKRNRYLWLAATATPQFRPEQEKPFQVISTFSDVTTLKRDRDLFALTQELANIGGWEWDPTHQHMHWSQAMYRLLGHDPQAQLSLEALLEHVHEADQTRVSDALQRAARDAGSLDLECRMIAGRSRLRWMHLIGAGSLRGGRIYRVSGTLQDITKDKLIEQTLRQQASTDPLTGLLNRDAIRERISAAVERGEIERNPAVLHIDLDRFKRVNDLLGHEGGDALLRAAAERLVQGVGDQGSVARIGGDEFLVLVPDGGRQTATAIAARVTAAFSQTFPHGDEEFPLTSSVGLACFPEDGATVHQLLQNADAAVGESKRRGRNAFQAFNPALARQLSDRLAIEAQLRRALANQEFSLVYQPQVETGTGRMHAAEALLRWNNRLLGPMRPDIFIPHAESTGDIVRIGAWVIREACRQLRQWRGSGLALERIAVNVSFRQLLSDDFDALVLAALAEHDLPGDSLELEITERVVVDDAADTMDTLKKLKSNGVMITIDDFGEGYSALNYLRRLPIDALKISYGFMKGVPEIAADAAICRSIIDIARSLGLLTIGEGVESPAQQRFLLDQGVDLAQGYLFSKPVAPEALMHYRPPPGVSGN